MIGPMTRKALSPSATPFRVLPSHARLLQALAVYDRLTAEQTRRLLFGGGSLTYVQSKYKELADAGYVLRVPVGRPAPHGSGPYVYGLDRRGRALLRALGMDAPRRLRQSEERARSSPHLRHSIAVVDVLILHALLGRIDRRFGVAGIRGERELKSRAVRVTLPDGTRHRVALDAWVDMRINRSDGAEQVCVAYEVDGATEWQAAWRQKVRRLLAFEAGPYSAAFGTDVLLIAVVAPTDDRRDQLRRWTERELREQSAEEKADLFRIGTMPDDHADAGAFFLAPRWHVPGRDTAVPLIDEVAG
jgi:hypothetical protein